MLASYSKSDSFLVELESNSTGTAIWAWRGCLATQIFSACHYTYLSGFGLVFSITYSSARVCFVIFAAFSGFKFGLSASFSLYGCHSPTQVCLSTLATSSGSRIVRLEAGIAFSLCESRRYSPDILGPESGPSLSSQFCP